MSMFDDSNEVMENEEDEYSGFEVYDENEVYRRKLMAEALQAEDEETIASPIPENEQKAIVDNAEFWGKAEGTRLTLVLSSGALEYNGKVIANLKNAFLVKLKEKREGFYVKASIYSLDPPMVKLEFSKTMSDDFNLKI